MLEVVLVVWLWCMPSISYLYLEIAVQSQIMGMFMMSTTHRAVGSWIPRYNALDWETLEFRLNVLGF